MLIRGGRVVDRYQSLMNAGVWIPPFITSLTGITNGMVRSAPAAAKVMGEVADFVGHAPLAAHNASFDRKFWDAELARIRRVRRSEFACSMLLARRMYPDAGNHRLDTLMSHVRIPVVDFGWRRGFASRGATTATLQECRVEGSAHVDSEDSLAALLAPLVRNGGKVVRPLADTQDDILHDRAHPRAAAGRAISDSAAAFTRRFWTR